MSEPQDLTASDKKDGFVVIKVGGVNDQSEFDLQTYGYARVYITAYVPTQSRGRLNRNLYKEYERKVNNAISVAENMDESNGYIAIKNSTLSMDSTTFSTANNMFYTFVKSFRIFITQQTNE